VKDHLLCREGGHIHKTNRTELQGFQGLIYNPAEKAGSDPHGRFNDRFFCNRNSLGTIT